MTVAQSRRRRRPAVRPRDPQQIIPLTPPEAEATVIPWVDTPSWDQTTTLRAHRARIERLTGHSFRIVKLAPATQHCPAKWTRAYQRLNLVQRAYVLLGHKARPTDDEFDSAFGQLGLHRSRHNRDHETNEFYLSRKLYRERYGDQLAPNDMARSPIVLAPAGAPEIGGPRFRSRHERRLAAALDRLGIRWDFEPDFFYYRDWNGRQHRYTPDFLLLDFSRTYVEVKGLSGADAGDQMKMASMLAAYPSLTLLLWDSDVIDYIEEMTDRSEIIPLLRTTSVRAA